MNLITKRLWVLPAVLAMAVVVVGSGAAAEEPKVEHKKVVIKTGEGPGEVFVWASDGDDPSGPGSSWLGVGLREETKLSEGGARVTTVVEGSPAEKAGIKEGDVIVGFQGEVIRGPTKLTEKIHETKPGESVRLEVVRDGTKRTVTAEIGERKSAVRIFGPHMLGEPLTEEQQKALQDRLHSLDEKLPDLERKLAEIEKLRAPRAFAFGGPGRFYFDMGGPKLGVELVEATPELREHLGGTSGAGVLVGKVLPGSAAEKAGLKVGDLIVRAGGDEVEEASDLVGAVQESAGKTLELEVVRDGRTTTIRATIPEASKEEMPRGPRASRWVAPAPPAVPASPPAALTRCEIL